MRTHKLSRNLSALLWGLFVLQGCDSSAPEQPPSQATGLVAILEITPVQVTADGQTAATIQLEVRHADDASPVEGLAVELRSSRNVSEAIDLLGAESGLTDAAGLWTTSIKSSTPGEVTVEAVGTEVEICKPKEETCQPVVATLAFEKKDVVLPPAPCGSLALSGDLMPLTDTAGNSCYPQIIPGDQGFALVYDEDDGGGMFYGDRRVFIAQYDGNGVTSGAAAALTEAGTDSNRPSAVALEDGYAVVYQAEGGLDFQKLSADGSPVDGPIPIIEGNYDHGVIARGDGRYGVAFTGRGVAEGKSTTWFITLDDSGAVTTGPVDLSTDNSGDHPTFPQVVSDESGFGVAWQDRRAGSLDLYFRKVQADGAPAADEVVVRQDLESVSVAVKMVWTGAEYGLVFSDTREAYGHYQVFLARIKADCSEVLDEVQLTTGEASADTPGLAFWQGRYWVAWVEKPWSGDPEPFAPMPQSPLIDAGVDVGLPYNGAAPDIGAIEFGSVWGGQYTTTIYVASLDPATGQLAGPLKIAENTGFSAFPVLQNVDDRMTVVWFDTENDLRNIFGAQLICQH